MKLELTLPWPPSANHYKGITKRGGVYVTPRAKQFTREVWAIVTQEQVKTFGTKRLSVLILAHPPDRRDRDLGNVEKCVMDSLEATGVFDNDAQADELCLLRCEPVKNGKLIVKIKEFCACSSLSKHW